MRGQRIERSESICFAADSAFGRASDCLGDGVPGAGRLDGLWVLTDLRRFHGAARTKPGVVLHFRLYKNGVMSYGCSAAQAVVGIGTLNFIQRWLTTANTGCPHLDLRQNQFVFARLLTGTARWRITDNRLTIYHGTNAATFKRDTTS